MIFIKIFMAIALKGKVLKSQRKVISTCAQGHYVMALRMNDLTTLRVHACMRSQIGP